MNATDRRTGPCGPSTVWHSAAGQATFRGRRRRPRCTPSSIPSALPTASREAGFVGPQAEALARILGDELTEQLLSKADFNALYAGLTGRMDALESNVNSPDQDAGQEIDGHRFAFNLVLAALGYSSRSSACPIDTCRFCRPKRAASRQSVDPVGGGEIGGDGGGTMGDICGPGNWGGAIGLLVLLGAAPAMGQTAREGEAFRVGRTFRDDLRLGGKGPLMVVVPAGGFLMGSPSHESGRYDREGPVHGVTIG